MERVIGSGEIVGGRYKLESLSGKGGMAQVWSATDLQADRVVAVKFLRPDEDWRFHVDTVFRRDEIDTVRKRFKREGTLLGRIDHPGIPKLFEVGDHGSTPYLVMQFIEGAPLHKFLERSRPLILTAVAAIATQIASALECAHAGEIPVVHRDLKPPNVIIASTGFAVLIDFGIAYPLGIDVTRYTQDGSSVGSPGYQAPEQIRGDAVTPKTDTYALGCVIFEMLAGRTPFLENENENGGMQGQHLDAPPPSLMDYVRGVSPELDALVSHMLAKNPEDRPDMGEVQRVFRAYLPKPGSPAPSPTLTPDPTLPCRNPVGAQPLWNLEPTATVTPRVVAPEWLSARVVENCCDEVELELDAGHPGPASAQLAALVAAARKQWGPKKPLVRKVWQLAAEGLRIGGDCNRAAPLYQQMSDDLAQSRDPQDRTSALIWRLRAAECRLAGGDVEIAVMTLQEAETAMASLPALAAQEVWAVVQELKTELDERGHRT